MYIFQWLELLFPAWPIICNVLCLYFACRASPVFYLQYPVLLSAAITIMIAKPILEIMASIMTVCRYKCYITVLHFCHSDNIVHKLPVNYFEVNM